MDTIRSIGIIMDGNRRWAKERGLPSFEGHRAGYEALRELVKDAPRIKKEYGVEYVILYTFSTENWNRSKEEIGYLMTLFEEGFRLIANQFVADGAKDPANAIRVRVIGERERFSPAMQKLMSEVEEKTANFGGLTAVFALSYGGRSEILAAAKKLSAANAEMTEENFVSALWTAGIPDPDLIVRTSGEMRLSNFLPWQGVYSELFFTEKNWPDFTAGELEKILKEYGERQRRRGS